MRKNDNYHPTHSHKNFPQKNSPETTESISEALRQCFVSAWSDFTRAAFKALSTARTKAKRTSIRLPEKNQTVPTSAKILL
jgi:hypothetical protein